MYMSNLICSFLRTEAKKMQALPLVMAELHKLHKTVFICLAGVMYYV